MKVVLEGRLNYASSHDTYVNTVGGSSISWELEEFDGKNIRMTVEEI